MRKKKLKNENKLMSKGIKKPLRNASAYIKTTNVPDIST